MASFVGNMSLFSLIFVISFLVIPSSSRLEPQTTKPDIDSICSKSRNVTFCQEFLKSDPNISTANLTSLDYFVLNRAWGDAQSVKIRLETFINHRNKTGPVATNVYKTCYGTFDGAFYDFEDAQRSLQYGERAIKMVNMYVARAMKAVESCRIAFVNLGNDPFAPLYIELSESVEDVGSIAVVISSMLLKHN